MAAPISITWKLNVIGQDRAARDVLRADRALRRSLEQTDKAYAARGRVATASDRTLARAVEIQRRAEERAARAAQSAARAQQNLARSSSTTAATISRGTRVVNEQAQAYQRLGREAEHAARREARARSVASRVGRGVGAAGRRVAGGAASGMASGGGAAAGLAGGLASRTLGLAGAAGLGFGLASAGRDAVGFEKQMAGVQARLLGTQAEMRRLSDFALDLGAKTQFSAGEAAGAMQELAAQGFGVQQIFKVLPGTLNLAAASGTDLANAATIQTAALRGFGLAGDQAGRVADVLAQTANRSAVDMDDLGETLKYIAPVAKATGQSFEAMLAAVGLMGNVGIKGSQAGTTLRTAMVRLTSPTDKARNALGDLGINADKLRGPKGLLPLPVILGKIVKGAQGVSKGTRNAALAAIFGREALSGMVTLVEGGPKKFAAWQKAAENSSGASKRAADIMRNTVSGAWDNFTGSVETATIKLTRKFMPAIKGALNAAAGGVNTAVTALPKLVSGIGAGLGGRPATERQRFRDEGTGRIRTVDVRSASATAQVGEKIGRVALTIGQRAAAAGKQLLDAFKPALPFLRNVLLPLLLGIGKGVLGSVVAAFKVAVPVIKLFATGLGFIGKLAAPLRGVLGKVGMVIGFVFGGPILKAIGLVGKLGGVFKLLAVPIRLVGSALSGVGGIVGKVVGPFVRLGGRVLSAVTGGFGKVVGFLGDLGGKFVSAGAKLVSGVARPFVDIGSKIANKVRSVLGDIGNFFLNVGKAIVRAIVKGIKSAPGAIKDAVVRLVPSPKSIFESAVDFVKKRRGGRIQGYQSGGLVPILAAGGEMLVDGPQAGIIPGDPYSDRTLLMVRPGSAVLTADGQARMAAGASVEQALAAQAPHFRAGGRVLTPGQMASLAYRQGRVRPAGAAIRMGAIGMRESRGRPWTHNYDPPRDDSWGLWQINVLPGANPQYRRWNLTDPAVNATAMGQLYRRAGFRPWGGYAESSYSRWLDPARRGFRANGAGLTGVLGASSRTVRTPVWWGRSRTRGGLLDDAFGAALDAAREGSPIGRWVLVDQLRDALSQVTTTRDLQIQTAPRARARARRLGRGRQGLVAIGRAAQAGGLRVGEHPAFGGVHGRHSPTSWHYRGRAIDVTGPLARLGAFAQLTARQTGARLAEEYWRGPRWVNIKNGRRVGRDYPGALAAPDRHTRHVHVAMRRGGRVGRYRQGGIVAVTPASAIRDYAAGRGSLPDITGLVADAVTGQLERLRRRLLSQVQRAGDAKVISRLRAGLSAIDDALGGRIGRVLRRVDVRSARSERFAGRTDRALRRAGIDPAGAQGTQVLAWQAGLAVTSAQQNVADLKRARDAARRAGQGGRARALTEQLAQARDDLDEAVTVKIERDRDVLAAARQALIDQAQQRVDTAQFGLDTAQGALAGLDISQRLARTADTPGGMLERARAIQATLLPALTAQRDALAGQYQTLAGVGDLAGARQALLAVTQAGNDIASAMADAADLVRQAAMQAAQDAVDAAGHTKTMADLGLQRLELEQRLAGTYDAGGQSRADYIKQTLIPALDAELAALRAQQATARQQGDAKLADQIAEAIAGKQNDILQAQLDATEQIAANTEKRGFGGTLGFTFGSESLTDAIIAVGSGS